jgi:hypothetical protein
MQSSGPLAQVLSSELAGCLIRSISAVFVEVAYFYSHQFRISPSPFNNGSEVVSGLELTPD